MSRLNPFGWVYQRPRISNLSKVHQKYAYLAISDADAAEDQDELTGVTHVYSFLSESKPLDSTTRFYTTLGIRHRYYSVEDEVDEDITPILKKAYKQLDIDRREENAKILIHCRQGVSRSATFLIYHLMRSWKLPLGEAYLTAKRARHKINPNSGFLAQLTQLEKELVQRWEEARRGMALSETPITSSCILKSSKDSPASEATSSSKVLEQK